MTNNPRRIMVSQREDPSPLLETIETDAGKKVVLEVPSNTTKEDIQFLVENVESCYDVIVCIAGKARMKVRLSFDPKITARLKNGFLTIQFLRR